MIARGVLAAILGVATVLGGGCAATPATTATAMKPVDVETLPISRGADGTPVAWGGVLAAIADADVVIVGEAHDDAVGHQVELAIVEAVLERWPASAVSMEMLDRSEQAAVDDYLAGMIDLDRFLERTAATRWRKIVNEYLAGTIDKATFAERIERLGWIDWLAFYQPVIDAAKASKARVVAANTPWLVYTSVARRDGFEALDGLTPAQKALFDTPREMPGGEYRERFWEVIAGRAEGEAPAEKDDGEAEGHGHSLTDEQVLGMYRGQTIMDATMAASIAAALEDGATKVVHLVGHFHCDYEGGLVQELRRRAPGARILVVSMPGGDRDDADDDTADPKEPKYGRADFVIDTRSDPIS